MVEIVKRGSVDLPKVVNCAGRVVMAHMGIVAHLIKFGAPVLLLSELFE